ncbi:type III restriction endonuclease subunit R [Chlorobaculum limnaeum]|uniref:Type III restriction endonuclease subunit R n=1 Tax=Chlorobaculum limnaeum TaxID=274537 RepID=A0A1D8D390_CHLLM|nr:DEAD/DEAH box helicase family protein [Chlorobaculum limnaeum]AOS83427.1 type III restriction endonuclease subunit R [Chlorobaculum limnaeum]
MALRELDYQGRVLARLDDYLTELAAQKKRSDDIARVAAEHPALGLTAPDFTANTWEAMRKAGNLPLSRQQIPFSPRLDGLNRPVPNIVFKVPTGGGKTFLAVAALSKIFGRYLGQNRKFVLWIVPNEAIYAQTKRQLTDRQHPYRQMLDVLSGNAVRILEKSDQLDARDVESHLCVMLLMLQSGNRENRDSLKMFRDRGDVHGFFPPEGDQEAHEAALERTPNLDCYDLGDSAYPWRQIKDSLGNALRLIRPVVVMDEGHKAVSELAFATLYGFNPCFVLELTATPKDVAPTTGKNPKPARYSNVLVEVQGIDLDREGMIKMPLNLDPRSGSDWHATLTAALGRLRELDAAARTLQADTGRYIRPILLAQVERTGNDQRDGAHIHALDVREWLTNTAGLDEAEIAIKTADTNDLAAPENQDLLSPLNRIRVIITKQALQEGWDCPFAYVLCALAASSNLSAMTQLVGRILRQPSAQKTGVPLLDESYVITHHADTAKVVEAIKKGLEEDGMSDLVREIRTTDSSASSGARTVYRRPQFARTQIYLPLVLRVEGDEARPLRYEEDILSAIDWQQIDLAPLAAKIPDNASAAEQQMQRIRLVDSGGERIVSEAVGASQERLVFDTAHAVRMISDIVPNAWWAREIVGDLFMALRTLGFSDAALGRSSGLIVEELRKWLEELRTKRAETLFRHEVAEGRIQFRLRADGRNWQLPETAETFEPEGADQLIGKSGGPLEKSLFSPIYKGDFSSRDERDVAVYLDSQKALTWWHRNVARSHYSVQGWRREKVYPDFIFAMQQAEGKSKLVVLEMKGNHLAGNDDTEYKKAVLNLMTTAFAEEPRQRIGELELVHAGGPTVECDLVLFPEWKTRLPDLMK